MSELRKAAEQLLGTLEETRAYLYDRSSLSPYDIDVMYEDSVSNLRAALAEPDEIAAAVAVERETCAKVAEEFGWSGDARFVAMKIRERGAP